MICQYCGLPTEDWEMVMLASMCKHCQGFYERTMSAEVSE